VRVGERRPAQTQEEEEEGQKVVDTLPARKAGESVVDTGNVGAPGMEEGGRGRAEGREVGRKGGKESGDETIFDSKCPS